MTQTGPSGTTTYTYNNLNELLSAGPTTYSYDANGNETAAGSRTFSFNAANQLISTTSAGTTTTYSYDGDGNRLSATNAATTTNYLWDTRGALPQLALERDGSGNALRSYLYGRQRISMNSGGSAYYYSYDGLGSVANVTSPAGTTEWTYSYDPFGAIRTQTQNDPNAPTNPMQFSGEYIDATTGLYDLRARQYDPSDGRFLSQDPMTAAAGAPDLSAYAYADDAPTTRSDPSGQITLGICGNFSVGLGWWAWNGSGCLQRVLWGKMGGQMGLTGTIGKGHGAIVGAGVGASVMVSNAARMSALARTFHFVTLAVPIPPPLGYLGVGATVFWDGRTGIYGADFGVSVGWEAGAAYGHSYTWIRPLGGVSGWFAGKAWDYLTPAPVQRLGEAGGHIFVLLAWAQREIRKYSSGN